MKTLRAVRTYFGGAAHRWQREAGNGSPFSAASAPAGFPARPSGRAERSSSIVRLKPYGPLYVEGVEES